MKKTYRMKLLAVLNAAVTLLTALTGCATGDTMTTEIFDLTSKETAQWTVGFGQAVLPYPETSDNPIYIAGYNQGWDVSGILDEQRASAVWLDCGGEGILIIGIDCVGLSNKYVEDIRTDLAAECAEWGCAAVHVYSTHTHAGIDTLGLWGPLGVDGKNPEFQQILVEGAFDAACQAYENRRIGTLTYSSAETVNALRDSRDPQVYDPFLHQIRFKPDDGSGGLRIISYTAHAESLRGDNTYLSRDFPGEMADIFKAETGDDMMYMPAALGGLLMTRDFCEEQGFYDYEQNMRYTGRLMADYLLAVPESEEVTIEPVMTSARTKFSIPLDNTAFMYYRFLGILDNTAVPDKTSGTGYALVSELSVLTLGDYTLTLIPGEIFPELVYGGYFDDDMATSPENENPVPLTEIAAQYGHDNLLICGLANDELGYIVPPNDFLLSPIAPFFDKIDDHKGENHYEETNSVGIHTAHCIAEAFEAALKALAEDAK